MHLDVIGQKVLGGDPMRRDTIFRIIAMTTPVTAAAAMIPVEECKLRLHDPADRLLPELADRKGLKRIDGPLDDAAPAPADQAARPQHLPPRPRHDFGARPASIR